MCDYNSDSSSMSFENVRRRRIPRPPSPKPGWDDEMPQHQEDMPDVLYRAEFRSSSGRLVESRQDSKPLDNLSWEKHGDKDGKLPVIEILTRISAPYPFGRDHGLDYAPPPPRDYNSSDSEDEDNDVISPGMNDNRKLVRTDMVVHSKHLQAALTAVVGYYPGFDRFHDKHKIEAPYQVLIHHREALEHFKHNQPSCHDAEYAATTAKHIDILLNFLAEAYSEQLALEAKRWEKPTGPTATFDLFWVLLKPGEIVYRKPQLTPYVLHSVTRMVGSDGRQNGYLVNMWNVAWGRTRLQRRMVQIIVPPWTGERAIDTLTIIPARFLPGGGKAMAEQQIKLGRTHWELAKGPAYREYDGSLSYKEGREGKITGRVIVDCEGFARFGDGPSRHRMAFPPRRRGGRGPPPRNDQLPQIEPRCTCHECARVGVKQGPSPWAGFDKADPKNASTLPPNHDLFFHVLGPQIPAFILSERRWGKVLVSGLSDVKSDQDAFKYLVLDPEIKLTVKAMIGKFASQDGKLAPWPSDFIKNKGEGRIFLLHGSPGVGKTCTAECAAELARRPLLALTSGDINTSMHADSVEDSLNYFLKLGERFGALVLLDEADVYLEQRHTRDLQRNGLVSVFLRALEYYKGVLFLTTNRVEAFDDAFTSRIHVALHYKRLGDAERARIWMHNFERLERDSNNKVFIPQSTKEFAFESPAMRELRWNGREIRNALQTAVALAETEALEDGLDTITVQDRHLKAVVRMSSGFKTFLSNRRAREYGGGRAPRGGKGRHGRAFCVPEDDDDDDDDDDIDNDEKRDTAESNEYDQTEETEESDN